MGREPNDEEKRLKEENEIKDEDIKNLNLEIAKLKQFKKKRDQKDTEKQATIPKITRLTNFYLFLILIN